MPEPSFRVDKAAGRPAERRRNETTSCGRVEVACESELMKEVVSLAERGAPTDTTVLIQGESGTGKEVLARHLHQGSPRAAADFVAINCGALAEALLESELFGHERGAFTGAVERRKGLFELADGGTVFLDEVGEMSSAMQVKVLRVLQSRELRRLGGSTLIDTDARIVAASNKDLHREVREGRFRLDLYYRLNVVLLVVPPLRERIRDIPVLVEQFSRRLPAAEDRELRAFSPDALELLAGFSWEGNVRELENTIERAVVLAREASIGPELIPEAIRGVRASDIPKFDLPLEGISFKEVVVGFETQLIEQALMAAGGVQKRAAEMLGIKPTTLNEMIKRRRIPLRARSGRSKRESSAVGRSVISESSGSSTERAV